ncbi:MAG: protein-tyrosine-phosphatase [Salegentibacter sp.]
MTSTSEMYPRLANFISRLNPSEIPAERQEKLEVLSDFIRVKLQKKEKVAMCFICTHNSRRSQFAQVWASALSYYFGIPNISSHSGGTEVTAVFPEVLRALQHCGFRIETFKEGSNPVYHISYSPNQPPVKAFSKVYDDASNPQQDIAAIMTCSEAEKKCPLIPGASVRIALPFEDPKAYDGSPVAAEKYTETSRKIANELLYVFSKIAQK